MPPLVAEDYCFAHHPDTSAAAHDARRKGGQRSRGSDASPAPIDMDVASLPGRMELVAFALHQTFEQANTPARSRALAALVRLAHTMDTEAEQIEIREQLQELTRLVEEKERGGYGY
jgi:hypothetical protein